MTRESPDLPGRTGPGMLPYRAPGRVRQIAYSAILSLAAAGAAGAAWMSGPWAAAPGCLGAYLVAYLLHEHVLWRAWSRWHGVPDLSGQWRNDGDHLVLRQTWTRLALSGTLHGRQVASCLAGWCDDPAVLQVVLVSADDPMLTVQVRQAEAGRLSFRSPVDAFPPITMSRMDPGAAVSPP